MGRNLSGRTGVPDAIAVLGLQPPPIRDLNHRHGHAFRDRGPVAIIDRVGEGVRAEREVRIRRVIHIASVNNGRFTLQSTKGGGHNEFVAGFARVHFHVRGPVQNRNADGLLPTGPRLIDHDLGRVVDGGDFDGCARPNTPPDCPEPCPIS